jgi:putative DNA methylase
VTYRKKLIEVALPLESINAACKADKGRKTGHIRNIHKWFAPMPLPALRALLFATVLDAPEDGTVRASLLALIADLVANGPEAPANDVLRRARDLLHRQLNHTKVWILDPFVGGGSTLVEAQRLGLAAEGSDLNPLPVLISRVLTDLPGRNRDRKPLAPESRLMGGWSGLSGFEEDIRWYARRVGEAARASVGQLYPNAPNGDPVIYWWWAHSVPSPDPAFGHCTTPLVTTWQLSLRDGDEQFLVPEPNRESGEITFRIERKGTPPPPSKDRCLFSNTRVTYEYVREQARRGRLKRMLIAMVSDGSHGRQHWVADAVHQSAAVVASPPGLPKLPIPNDGLGISVQNYGITEWRDLFTERQQRTLLAFAEAIRQVPEWVAADGGDDDYGRDIAALLGLCLGKLAQASSTIVRLNVRKGPSAKAEPAFARGDIQLNWDFAETNPFAASVGGWSQVVTTALRAYGLVDPTQPAPTVRQADVRQAGCDHPGRYVIITDPPYFAAIGYADLSEYFYYWIRLALKDIHPDLFATVGVPKLTELIASPGRHGGRVQAAEYFVKGFTEAFTHLASIAHEDFPMVVVYAQRQEEQSDGEGASTGWEAMLEALLRAGLGITATWPVWGTGSARMRSHGSNSLASYVVLACRPRPANLLGGSRRDFAAALRKELPDAFVKLQQANVAPVDLAQAAIGPGMAVFSRYSKVIEADGGPMSVRTALQIINQELDAYLAEQEGEMDRDTRFCIAWFDQNAMDDGEFGQADVLARAMNTAVNGLAEAGVVRAKAGKVKLLGRDELPKDWDPASDRRLTVWECTQQLIRALEEGGEQMAAALAAKLGTGKSEEARALAYRLYAICERKKWAKEALAYNSLVVAWPEIVKLAASKAGVQTDAFGRE